MIDSSQHQAAATCLGKPHWGMCGIGPRLLRPFGPRVVVSWQHTTSQMRRSATALRIGPGRLRHVWGRGELIMTWRNNAAKTMSGEARVAAVRGGSVLIIWESSQVVHP